MNLFVRPIQEQPAAASRRVRWAFVVLFLAGVALRGVASFTTLAIIFADEHQQFLEQAQRLVYGYGHQFWEQDRGIRHPFYPALLAAPLAGLEAVGISDPLLQGSLLRLLVSVLALLAAAMFAWEFHRRGDSMTALLLMFMLSLSPDVIYTNIHPLSETAATIPCLLAIALLDRRPFWSGVLLGASFGIRFQMGFLVAAIAMLAWVRNHGRFDRPFLMFAAGLALSLFSLGLSDRIVFGEWFHSPREYVQANLVEGVANWWGVEPWYQYIVWLGLGGWAIIIPLALLVIIGARRQWTLLFLALCFIVPHMLIAHKEARFLLPIAPLMLALAALGYCEIGRKFDERFRGVWFILGLVGMTVISVVRFADIDWNNDRGDLVGPMTKVYPASAILLRSAGQRNDFTGIAVMGTFREYTGNYFYLRRKSPLVVIPDATLPELRRQVGADLKLINYLIIRPDQVGEFASLQPEEIKQAHGFGLYRISHP